MQHLGDFNPSDTIDFKFVTAGSTGAPTALTSGAISVYKDDSTTQSTSGVTLTASFDSVTGLNHVRITTSSDGSFYAAGSSFQVVITTGTVDSVSVVGYVVANFTIRQAAAYDAIAGTPDVNVAQISGDSTAADNLEAACDGTGYNVGAGAVVAASVTGDVGGNVTGNVGGNVTGSIGSLGATAKSDVNAEVVDVLATDTYAEPGQGTPAATLSLAAKINYLFKAWRNKTTQTATTYTLFADDGTTTDQVATVSDDGTTFTRGEVGTGA